MCYNIPMLDRNKIINYLRDFAIKKDYVLAMWLEGADGLGKIDEYSDIDFWFDVEKGYQNSFLYECLDELQKIGEIDSRVDKIRPEIAQSNIHLANTSEYLMLDICVQSHENRGDSSISFFENDIAESPLAIFDKNNLFSFQKRGDLNLEEIKEIFMINKNRIFQESRVTKYINRGQYLEAYLKYLHNIANPLVVIVRLIYTPEHYDYELCHISDHLPKEVVRQLEELYKIKDFDDISKNLKTGKHLLELYEQKFNEKYHIA